MKRSCAIFLVLLFISGAFAAFETKDWGWESSIEPDGNAAGFVRLPLPPWVFDTSEPDLRDLRILDGAGNLVQHLIHRGRDRSEERFEWSDVRMINTSFKSGKSVCAVLDFGGTTEKNRLKIETTGENFRRRVLIEGGPDSVSWERIADDLYIFDITQEGRHIQADVLRFPINNFRYLRLTLHLMPDDPARIEILSVKAALCKVLKEEWTEQPMGKTAVSHDEKNKETILEWDMGFRNTPVAAAKLSVDDPHFYRGYVLEGRNSLKTQIRRKTETGWDQNEKDTPWVPIRQGVLYRVLDGRKISESLEIENIPVAFRYFRIRIFDRDNPPLALKPDRTTVFCRNISLIFKWEKDLRYRLIGGNPAAALPHFDLGQSVANLAEKELSLVHVRDSSPIAHAPVPVPWTERYKILIWVVLILAVGTVAGLLVSSLRSLKTPPNS